MIGLEEKKELIYSFQDFTERVNSIHLETFRNKVFSGKQKKIVLEPVSINEYEDLKIVFSSPSIANTSYPLSVSNGFELEPFTVKGNHDSITYLLKGKNGNTPYVNKSSEECIKEFESFVDYLEEEISEELESSEEENKMSQEEIETYYAELSKKIEEKEIHLGKLKEKTKEAKMGLIRILNSIEDVREYKKENYKEILEN